MSGAITAVGVGLVGSAIMGSQAASAAQSAANRQSQAADAATQVERERLQMEYQQYLDKMKDYRRNQAISEKQMQQSLVNLAPYMQAGQGALYEMMALTGLAAPKPVRMPQPLAPQPIGDGNGGSGASGGDQIVSIPQPVDLNEARPIGMVSRSLGLGGLYVGPDNITTAQPSPLEQAQKDVETRYLDQLREQKAFELAQSQVPNLTPSRSPYYGMSGEQAQRTAIQRISDSPLLQELMRQGEVGILQNAAATGGLRGGRTQAALAQFRPAMLQQEIDKLYGRLQGISGLGQQSILGSPTTAVGAAPTYSGQSQIPNLLTQGGAAQAGGILGSSAAQQNMIGNMAQTIGWGIEKFANPTPPPPMPTNIKQAIGIS